MKKLIINLLMVTTILTATKGVNYYNGHKETFYNLPMERVTENARKNEIPGAYWLREDGVKMWGHYVIVAAPFDVHPYGSTLECSLGDAVVLDTGEFAQTNKSQIDIATAW